MYIEGFIKDEQGGNKLYILMYSILTAFACWDQ